MNTRENKPVTHYHLTIVAALLSMLGPFTIDTYLPSFPDIELEFAVSRAVLSQTLAIYLVAFAVSTLFWGPLADRIGRKQVILSSLALYIIASAGCAMAENITTFMVWRLLQGLAASGGLIAGRAMIRDAHDTQSAHKAMSQAMLLFALAPAIAPVLGGWLHDYFGWRSVFWFLSGFALSLLLLASLTRETLAKEYRQSFHPLAVIKVYLQAMKKSRFLGLVFSMAFSFAGLFLYIAGAPSVIFDFLGLGSDDFSVQFIPMVAGMMIGAYLSSRLAHRWATQKVAYLGLGIMSFAIILNLLQAIFLSTGIIAVITPLVIYVLGMAMTMPAITILALDCFPDNRGAASSVQGFIQMLTNAAVASIAVPLLHTRQLHFVIGQLVFLLLALLLWFRFVHNTSVK